MTENTVSGYEILFAMARTLGELSSGVVTTATSATSLACANITEAVNDTYNGGLIHKQGGTTYATISDYTGASRTFTLAGSGLSGVAVTDVLQWAWWNADKRGAAFEAINDAIRQAVEVWTRTKVTDRNTSTITLAVGTNVYDLPSDLVKLNRIGVQIVSIEPIEWFENFNTWEVIGEEGAKQIRFNNGFNSTINIAPMWSSNVRLFGPRRGTFSGAFPGQNLCLEYEAREPQITSESGTTRLPLDYVSYTAALSYAVSRLANASPSEQRQLNMHIPQLQQQAAMSKARLSRTKPKPRQSVRLDF